MRWDMPGNAVFRSRVSRGSPAGKTMNELKRFVSQCDGQDLVEYGLLIAVVALGAVAALSGFQNIIGNVWSMISNNLNSTN